MLSNFGEVGDKAVIEFSKSLEGTTFCSIGRDLPFFNTGNFVQIHHDRAIFQNNSKEFNSSLFDNAFAGL